MNELIGSFAGKRLAIFGVLIAAIALLVAGGALSTRTAQAHDPADTDRVTGGRADLGLDHIVAGEKHGSLKLTLAVNTRHHVCLVQNLHDQQFRTDSDDTAEPGTPDDGDNTQVDSDNDGMVESSDDIDDWDWDIAADSIQDADDFLEEVGPRGIITTAPRAGSGIGGEATLTGWNWLIAKKANTPGTPTVTNPSRTFKNDGENGEEACVHWTSTAPGTQIIQLYSGTMLAATGVHVANFGAQDADFAYAEGDDPHPAATSDGHNDNDWKLDDPATQLEVTWVDSDPLITVTRAIGNFAPTQVTAPIAQRMDFVGGTDAAYTSENNGEITVNVAAVQSALQNQALTGSSVSFAVTGTCGIVNVPGAIISATARDDIRPGQTGTIANWGTAAVVATFKNAGTGASDSYPKCRLSSSSTTLTITSGGATNTVTVNWDWDGYGVFTLEDVDDTTKRVTFQSATPKSYNALGQSVGWECNQAGQDRVLSYNVDGRATVSGAGNTRLGTASVSATGVVTPTSQGRATPLRTLGALDSECQVSWTIKSPSRAADVYVDISTLGVDGYSEVLNFAPEAPAVTTFDDLEAPLAPGIDFILWTGADTAVADAIGDSGATAVYQWNAATQSWLSFFPGSEGLGVNSLTSLQQGSIYVVSTPRN